MRIAVGAAERQLQLEVNAKGYEPVLQPVGESDFVPEPRDGEARPQSQRVVPVLLRKAK